jgi:hypothetical protein
VRGRPQRRAPNGRPMTRGRNPAARCHRTRVWWRRRESLAWVETPSEEGLPELCGAPRGAMQPGGMEGPTCGRSQQAAEAGGSLTLEAPGWVGAASTTTGRVGTARRPGSGKRDGEVYECRNQWWNPLKSGTGSDLVDLGWCCSASVASKVRGPTRRRHREGRGGGHGEGLRRSRGEGCRGRAGHLSRPPVGGERGNRRRAAFSPPGKAGDGKAGDGKARRLLMARRRGGVLVVVRAWESDVHGEGGQRVRSCGTGMPGGRR